MIQDQQALYYAARTQGLSRWKQPCPFVDRPCDDWEPCTGNFSLVNTLKREVTIIIYGMHVLQYKVP